MLISLLYIQDISDIYDDKVAVELVGKEGGLSGLEV